MSTNAKKPLSKIGEILEQLAEKWRNKSQNQSLGDLSPVRKKSLLIFQKFDSLAIKWTKNSFLTQLVDRVVRPRIENLIKVVVPEEELKQVLNESYDILKPDIDDLEIAKAITETKLNPELNKKLRELPRYRELANLL